ncbi:hypothetical protein BDQ12DRAFT_668267 [Crucibulum laeve]|uniref:Uncharacterized protein n=1 Tax=Crucibulum laeve TaxID=68775 RepID=A0A5C3LTK3_9AGAR|nr:hypothetical protein BDQ12DRAFT_668267 [Crucibulum laeve]
MCHSTSKASKEILNDEDILICPSGFVISTPRSEADLGDVQSALRSRKAKIPFEVKGVDGIVSHPSGFVPPTAATDFYSQKRVPHAPSTRHATASSSKPRHSETDPSGELDHLATKK